MFSLLVAGAGWNPGRDTMLASRLFEYTEDSVADHFRLPDGTPDLEALCRLPAVFMAETEYSEDQVVRVGTILRAKVIGTDIHLEYVYDPEIPALSNADIENLRVELELAKYELSRTHWAVKDIDLFRTLLRAGLPRRQQPKVFRLDEPERIEPTLVSLMMPFDPDLASVHEVVKRAAESCELICRRADDIWDNPAVMQDIVSLIDRSAVVVADCTNKNPNVFYEIGIAHSLGREVIVISQNDADVPFDLKHLRYIKYEATPPGLQLLHDRLAKKLASLTS